MINNCIDLTPQLSIFNAIPWHGRTAYRDRKYSEIRILLKEKVKSYDHRTNAVDR